MTDAERVEGVFEGHDADELARRLGYPHHFGMDRESLWNAIIALGDLEVVYRPWTLRLVKNMPEPYLVLFSHESDAVHFRLIA